MRAQIRELIRPTMLLAAVLVIVMPSQASGLMGKFVAHTNQEDQVAHSNQERSVPGDSLAAGRPTWPVDIAAGADVALGFEAPPDAGAEGSSGVPWAGIGFDASGPAPAGRPDGGPAVVPAPGGLGLLGLAVLVLQRRRRRTTGP